MARPREITTDELRPRSRVQAVEPVAPYAEPTEAEVAAAEARAQGVLGQITLLAVPLDTYRKLEEHAQARGLRVAQLLQLALVEYVQHHPTAQPSKES